MTDLFVQILARVVPGARLVRTWPLQGGVSAYVHALELTRPDGQQDRLVVRRPGALAKGHRAEVVSDEFRLLERLRAAGLAVAEPLWLDERGEIFGSPCMVLAFVEGSTDLPADAVQQMASTLAHLHSLDPVALGVDFLPRRLDPADDGGQESLSSRHTALGRLSLLHGDYWPGNLLWQDGRLAAVLDWEDAAVGDPLSDVAGCRQELLWRLGEQAMEDFTGAYQALAPVDRRDLAVWERFVARAALENMGLWGLPPEQEALMRRRSEAFVASSWR